MLWVGLGSAGVRLDACSGRGSEGDVVVLCVCVYVSVRSLPTDSYREGPFAPVPARDYGHLALRVGAWPVEYLV